MLESLTILSCMSMINARCCNGLKRWQFPFFLPLPHVCTTVASLSDKFQEPEPTIYLAESLAKNSGKTHLLRCVANYSEPDV